MPNTTNKELLQLLVAQTADNAKKQFTFSLEVSTFMNEQRDFNTKQLNINSEIKGFLESNNKTNQKGIIEQVDINKNSIHEIITEKKVEKNTIYAVGAVLTIIINVLAKFIFTKQ